MPALRLVADTEPVLSVPEGSVTLYKVPDSQTLFNAPTPYAREIREARKTARHRFVAKKNRLKVFGNEEKPLLEVRAAIRYFLKECYVDICSYEKRPTDTKTIVFVVVDPSNPTNADGILVVSAQRIIGGFVLPYDEKREALFIPTSTGHRIWLPLSSMTPREFKKMALAFDRLAEAAFNLKPPLHRDRSEHIRTREAFAEAGLELADVAHPNRISAQQRDCSRPRCIRRNPRGPIAGAVPGGHK